MKWSKYIPKHDDYRIRRRFAWLPTSVPREKGGVEIARVWLQWYWQVDHYNQYATVTSGGWLLVDRAETKAVVEEIKTEHAKPVEKPPVRVKHVWQCIRCGHAWNTYEESGLRLRENNQ